MEWSPTNETDMVAFDDAVPDLNASFIAACLVFLIVTIAASRLGVLFVPLGLPLITGYLFIGALAGPYVLGVVKLDDLPRLDFVTQFALAFVAFSAGAELYLPELRSCFKVILYETSTIALVSFVSCTALMVGVSHMLPWLAVLDGPCQWSVSSIAASIMVARSPASAIAVAKELRAKGVFTSTLLGITVFCDVYVLILFTLATTVAEAECNSNEAEGFSFMSFGAMIGALLLCGVVGWIVGKFLIVLMVAKKLPTRYLILPLGLGIFMACHALTDWTHDHLDFVVNIEPLLLCIVAGYVCTNQSAHRHRFILVLQQCGPYIFLPFFTLTGASLNLSVMAQSAAFALLMAAFRALTIFIGSYIGGTIAGQEKKHNLFMWMTLLTQAGVSLGLASEVGVSNTFEPWGRSFQTTIIAIVLVNQILGPVLFRIAVRRVGEVRAIALAVALRTGLMALRGVGIACCFWCCSL